MPKKKMTSTELLAKKIPNADIIGRYAILVLCVSCSVFVWQPAYIFINSLTSRWYIVVSYNISKMFMLSTIPR